MTAFEQITYEVADHVATITMNRPDRLNAFTPIMRTEMIAAFDMSDADDDVRVVIVTGAGRGFCAGADLSGSKPFTYDTPDQVGTQVIEEDIDGVPRDGGGMLALRIASSDKPVIAAINGAAVGVGATMTLPMDIRIAADTAKFGFAFARRGLVPEAASSWFLPRVVGIAQACDWALSGRIFLADEALRGGLLSDVVPADQLLPRAREIAAEIVANTSAVAVAAMRHMLWSMLSEPSPWTAHLIETKVIREMKAGGDTAEGGASFLEKRPPVFPMKVSADMPASAPSLWPQKPDDVVETASANTPS
ncbi:MAG: Enoyl-CoA hydratase [Nocardioidaceae bacterium]|nr:Enoyl-CoA hydratase [Nocardioidaceae bacterium]